MTIEEQIANARDTISATTIRIVCDEWAMFHASAHDEKGAAMAEGDDCQTIEDAIESLLEAWESADE